MQVSRLPVILAIGSLMAGCATMPTPDNLPGSQYQADQRISPNVAPCLAPAEPAAITGMQRLSAEALTSSPGLLGPGDRLSLEIRGDKGTLNGDYVVAADFSLMLASQFSFDVSGQDVFSAEASLRSELVRRGLVRDLPGNVRLTLAEAGSVPVSVEGAVFAPGPVRAGVRTAEERAAIVGHPGQGDYNAGRTLASALRAAGGIRPDAAAAHVYLVRGGNYFLFDVSPAFTGGNHLDPQLAAGDRIIVPSAGCFQQELVRPSSVTAPGIRVYMSNLSRPATHNAGSAIGKESTSLPYGTRLLQGLVSANCVGGSAMNGARRAVLISRNPITGQSVVVQRSVEGLVRDATRDQENPLLMPDDAIACYDSDAMSLFDAVGVIGSLLGPAVLINGLER